MAVCKYFRQGSCKFGNNCRFEHPPNLAPKQPAHSQNSFQRGPQDQGRHDTFGRAITNYNPNQRGGPPPRNSRDDRDGRNQRDPPYGLSRHILQEDLSRERPLWIMSAYGPGKDADIQLFGGFPLEQSPEEIRVLHYQALAAGNPQQSAQLEAELAAKANEQTQAVLNDINGALKYLESGSREHPNRNDICKAGTRQLGRNEHPYFAVASVRHRQRAAERAGGFNQPASNGIPSQQPQPTGFGQTPNGAPNMAFNDTKLGGGFPAVGFGQPAQQPLQPSAFGQGPTAGFGSEPQGTFGVSQAPHNNLQFGQATPAFGQQNNNLGFGQPQQVSPGLGGLQQQPMSQNAPAFDAPMNQAPAPQQGVGVFGQPQQPQTTMPQPMTNGLQQPQQQQPQPPGFGGNATQPAANGDVQSYTTRDASNKLLTWKGRPVNYVNGDQPCYRRENGAWERIWFPDGSPSAAAAANIGAAGAVDFPEDIKNAYAALKEDGQFRGGVMPEVAPSADLVRWDV